MVRFKERRLSVHTQNFISSKWPYGAHGLHFIVGYGIDYCSPHRSRRFLPPNNPSSPNLIWHRRNVRSWCSCGHLRSRSGLQRSHCCLLRLGFRLRLLKAILFEALELATPLGLAAPTAARSVVLCEVSTTMSSSFQASNVA